MCELFCKMRNYHWLLDVPQVNKYIHHKTQKNRCEYDKYNTLNCANNLQKTRRNTKNVV